MTGIVQDLTGRTSDFEAMEQAVSRLLDREVTPDRLAQAESGQTAVEIWTALEASGLGLALLDANLGGLGLEASAAFELLRLTAVYSVPVAIGETMIATALWGQPLDGQVTLISDFNRVPYGRQARFGVMQNGRDGIALIEMPQSMEPDRNLANEPRDAFKSDPAGHVIETRKPTLGKTVDVMACGALLRSVQMCGAMHTVLRLSIEHAKIRQQFGRPIGRFQAVQHMLADLASEVAAADAITGLAVRNWNREGFIFTAGLAKARVGEAAGHVAAIGHQILAANGFTRDHPLNRSTRRLWSWRDDFGNEAIWQQQIGRAICAEGGGGVWEQVLTANSGAQE